MRSFCVNGQRLGQINSAYTRNVLNEALELITYMLYFILLI